MAWTRAAKSCTRIGVGCRGRGWRVRQRVWFACAAAFSAGGDLGGSALHFGQFDEPALVEVDEAAPFGVGGVDLAVQPGQFGGEEFVIWVGVVSLTACSPASRRSGWVRAVRMWSKTKASRASARMLRSGQRRIPRRRGWGRGCGSGSSGARCRCGRASLWQLVPTPQTPHLTRPLSSQAPGSARRGLHLVLSMATRPAAWSSSSETMRGQAIGIDSSRSRQTCRLRWVGWRSGTDSVRL